MDAKDINYNLCNTCSVRCDAERNTKWLHFGPNIAAYFTTYEK